jgi:pimeloyl-ACP methyl ester carboxylesterase
MWLWLWGCTGPEGEQERPEERPEETVFEPGCAEIDGIHHLDRPLYPDEQGSPTFPYAVRLEEGTDPDSPVIVFLPGGPGQGSIEGGRAHLTVPAEYAVLYTDPRGVGCNAMQIEDAGAFYGTERFADDILAAVDDLGLQDVIYYGHSYGTALATVTASVAEARGTAPRAVVLEGVVGGVFEEDEGFDEYAAQWAFVMGQLPDTAAALSTEPLPLGLTSQQWGDWASARLGLGGVPTAYGPMHYVTFSLLPLEYGADTSALEQEVRAAAEAAAVTDPLMERLYQAVGCVEIAERSYFRAELVDGQLAPLDDWCADIEVTDPYDPADWPITAPITYVQGSSDPATPLGHALAHQDAQTGADRAFVEIAGGGHQPWILNLADCAAPMWDAIAAGEPPPVDGCSWPATVTVTPAQ